MAYTPPVGNAVDFNFTATGYTPPTGNAVDFNFGVAPGAPTLFARRTPAWLFERTPLVYPARRRFATAPAPPPPPAPAPYRRPLPAWLFGRPDYPVASRRFTLAPAPPAPFRRALAPWLFARAPVQVRPRHFAPTPQAAAPTPFRRPLAAWLFAASVFPLPSRRLAPIAPSPVRPSARRAPAWLFREPTFVFHHRPIGIRTDLTPRPHRRPWRPIAPPAWSPPPRRVLGATQAIAPSFGMRVPAAGAEALAGGVPGLRASGVGIEGLGAGVPNLRATAAGVEVIDDGQPNMRSSGVALEAVTGGQPSIRCCAVGIEVLTVVPPEPFMTTLVFPTLRGRSWSTTKSPVTSSRISLAQSGGEVWSANYPYPRWQFELTYSVLTSSSDLRAIMGLFLQSQCGPAYFLYSDPSDHQVRFGPIATADGVTLQWRLARDMAGFIEPIAQIDVSNVASFTPGAISLLGNSIDLTMAAQYLDWTIPSPAPATGDGPYFVSVAAGGTLPGELAAGTPYWAINIGGDVIQLATTWLAAMANDPLIITTRGTGAFTLAKGYSFAGGGPEAHSVPATPGPYTVTVTNAATYLSDQGVTSSGTPLAKVGGSPASGQYAVDVATGVYTFNAAQQGDAVEIAYTFQYAPGTFSIVAPNQVLFASAPPAGLTISGDFDFYFVCRFSDDTQAYENFMAALWNLKKCNFVAVPQ